MDEGTLIARLAALDPPSLEPTRRRAVADVPVRLRARTEIANGLDSRPHLRVRGSGLRPWGIAALVCVVALASFSLLSAPGQALTSWVGERLGLGEPGAMPALRQLRDAWTKGTAAEGRPAHVLAVGPVPGGGRYEFITYRPAESTGTRRGGWGDRPCFELDLTQRRNSFGADCGIFPEGPVLYAPGLAGNSAPGREIYLLSGRTAASIASVEVELNGTPIAVELVSIPKEFVERFRLGRPFKFFIAFLGGRVGGGTLTITARDDSGRVLATRQLDVFDPSRFLDR